MRILTLIVVISLISFAGCKSTESSKKSTSAGQWQTFGEVIAYSETDEVALGSLKGDERNIWIEGEITEVCSSQGCWIRMKDPANPAAGDLFVKTKDHAYLVPRNAHGHAVRVYGVCEATEMTVADQQHFAEEAGKSEAEIALITQPKKMIVFHATTIVIEGDGLDKALDQQGG